MFKGTADKRTHGLPEGNADRRIDVLVVGKIGKINMKLIFGRDEPRPLSQSPDRTWQIVGVYLIRISIECSKIVAVIFEKDFDRM